ARGSLGAWRRAYLVTRRRVRGNLVADIGALHAGHFRSTLIHVRIAGDAQVRTFLGFAFADGLRSHLATRARGELHAVLDDVTFDELGAHRVHDLPASRGRVGRV